MRAEKTARRILVSGRVQGVGFRAYTARVARDLGVTGWVRNLADGRVEALVSGTAGQLDALEERLREGPGGSEVRSVQCIEAEEADEIAFWIR